MPPRSPAASGPCCHLASRLALPNQAKLTRKKTHHHPHAFPCTQRGNQPQRKPQTPAEVLALYYGQQVNTRRCRPTGRGCTSMANSREQGDPAGDRAAAGRGARVPQPPAQAAQRPAEQSLRSANAEGDYSGLQKEQKPSTRIYSVPLLPPARPSSRSGLRVRLAPRQEQVTKGRAPAGRDSPRRKCQRQGLPELPSQPRCTAGSPKGSAGRMVLRDGTLPRDTRVLRDRQTPRGAGACSGKASVALVLGLLLIISS